MLCLDHWLQKPEGFRGGHVGKLFLPLFLLGLVGCLETKHLRNLPDQSEPQSEEKPSPADFVFSKVNEKVFLRKCTGCHSEGKIGADGNPIPEMDNPGNVNLQTYANAKRKVTYIKSAVESGMMGLEPMPALTNYERELVLGWIEAGSPE